MSQWQNPLVNNSQFQSQGFGAQNVSGGFSATQNFSFGKGGFAPSFQQNPFSWDLGLATPRRPQIASNCLKFQPFR